MAKMRQTRSGEAPPSGEGAIYSLRYQAIRHIRRSAEERETGPTRRRDWWDVWFDLPYSDEDGK